MHCVNVDFGEEELSFCEHSLNVINVSEIFIVIVIFIHCNSIVIVNIIKGFLIILASLEASI